MAKNKTNKKINMKNSNTTYQVGDFLIQIKNASMAKNKSLKVASTKKLSALAATLKKMGYLDEVKEEKGELTISLTFKNKAPLLTDVKLVSKPGLRVYKSIAEIEKKKGPGMYIISSSKGMVSLKEALKQRIGGEVIAEIF